MTFTLKTETLTSSTTGTTYIVEINQEKFCDTYTVAIFEKISETNYRALDNRYYGTKAQATRRFNTLTRKIRNGEI